MSIDWADTKHGTSIEMGKGIDYTAISHFGLSQNSNRSTSTIERGVFIANSDLCGQKEIEFYFKVPIDLRAISFSYSVDCWIRSTSGLKIITHSAQPQPSLFDPSPSSTSSNLIFKCTTLPRTCVTIINKYYQVSDSMRRCGFIMDPSYPLPCSTKIGIPSDQQANCLNIQRLRIKLTHLSDRPRVAVHRIMILGQPSAQAFIESNYRSLTDRILNHKPEIPRTPIKGDRRYNNSRGMRMVQASNQQPETTNNNNIPAEYLDPFTKQLMEFPMLLPCGKICDRGFLNKYLRTEKKWSRKPTDPFTGKFFVRDQVPELANELKSQIDKWCLTSMFGSIPDWYTG